MNTECPLSLGDSGCMLKLRGSFLRSLQLSPHIQMLFDMGALLLKMQADLNISIR